MIEKYALFKVIKKLLEEPKEYSIRGLAKEANIGLGTAKLSLDYLYGKKLLNKKVIGKTHQYSLNKYFLTKYIRVLSSLAQVSEAGLVEEILTRCKNIISIVLYGSAARGEDNALSDIDILIITRKRLKIMPLKAEKRINREVVILNCSLVEWKEKAKKDKVFYDRVIIDGIPLYGEIPAVI